MSLTGGVGEVSCAARVRFGTVQIACQAQRLGQAGVQPGLFGAGVDLLGQRQRGV